MCVCASITQVFLCVCMYAQKSVDMNGLYICALCVCMCIIYVNVCMCASITPVFLCVCMCAQKSVDMEWSLYESVHP